MDVPYLQKYLIFGAIGGLIYVVLSFSIYWMSPYYVANVFLKIVPLAAVIFTLLFAIQYRINNGNLTDIVYRDLVQAAFITFAITEIISVGYTFSLYNFIHELMYPDAPALDELIKIAMIKSEESRYASIDGVTRQNYEMMRAHIEAEDHTFPLVRAVKGLFNWLILGFGFSFLLAMFGMNRVKSLRNG